MLEMPTKPSELFRLPAPFSLFDRLMKPSWDVIDEFERIAAPAIDLYEKDGSYIVECALPGFKKEAITIDVVDNTLTIAAKSMAKRDVEKANYYYREMRRGSFSRSISFAQPIDPAKVVAAYESGVLTVTV